MTRAELKNLIAEILKEVDIEETPGIGSPSGIRPRPETDLPEDKTLQDLMIDSLATLEILAEVERKLNRCIPGRYDTSQAWFAVVDGHVNQMCESWTLGHFLNHLENVQRQNA